MTSPAGLFHSLEYSVPALKGRTYTMLCKKEVCDLDSAKSCSEGGFGQISEPSEGEW